MGSEMCIRDSGYGGPAVCVPGPASNFCWDEHVALVVDVVGADHLQRVGATRVLRSSRWPPDHRAAMISWLLAVFSLPATWLWSLPALPNAQAAPTGGRSIIFPCRHKNPWKFL